MPVDAGATAVTVEIRDGGTSFIRVTDNGSGIAADQVADAFLRHSTSKIRTVEDLVPYLLSGVPGRGAFQHCLRIPGGADHQDRGQPTPASATVIEGGEEKKPGGDRRRRTAPPSWSGICFIIHRPDGNF